MKIIFNQKTEPDLFLFSELENSTWFRLIGLPDCIYYKNETILAFSLSGEIYENIVFKGKEECIILENVTLTFTFNSRKKEK